MNAWAPVGVASWAVATCLATFVWLVAPERPDAARPDTTAPAESDALTVSVSGPEGTHYLTFVLRYVPDPAHADPVPLEATAQDLVIEAATNEPGLARAADWQGTLARVLSTSKEKLGVSSIGLVGARRTPAVE